MSKPSAQIQSEPATGTIRRALISVSDKTGIEPLAHKLETAGIKILSTGGTAKTLQNAGITVHDVSAYTGFPEIMDGRVKTLHPLIHGGLLGKRDDSAHDQAMRENSIEAIDLLVVNLYPFAQVVAGDGTPEECIENIDIGGPAMIRAAAKNHRYVTVLTDAADYDAVLAEINKYNGATTLGLRRRLATKAFALTAAYDAQIASWFAAQTGEDDFPKTLHLTAQRKQSLRYGENPHQKAALYLDDSQRPGIATASQIQGKELSFNNLNDTDAAFELVAEFEEPAVAIIKHANPCGVATGKDTLEAYRKALACDPVSAFGGIIALNRPLDAETSKEILKIFSEVIIAPSVEHTAMDVLKTKEKLRVLTTGGMPEPTAARHVIRSIAGGYLLQDADNGHISRDEMKVVTDREPTEQEWQDMLFAWKVAKHVKSNAIVYTNDGATVGIGAGQMSRIDSARIAARKAEDAAEHAGELIPATKGSAAASDAFFPFPDGLLSVADAGATAIIQPGGSIRDEEVIAAANERGLAMVFTGMRHFRH